MGVSLKYFQILKPTEGTPPGWHLDFGLLISRMIGWICVVFATKPARVCYNSSEKIMLICGVSFLSFTMCLCGWEKKTKKPKRSGSSLSFLKWIPSGRERQKGRKLGVKVESTTGPQGRPFLTWEFSQFCPLYPKKKKKKRKPLFPFPPPPPRLLTCQVFSSMSHLGKCLPTPHSLNTTHQECCLFSNLELSLPEESTVCNSGYIFTCLLLRLPIRASASAV